MIFFQTFLHTLCSILDLFFLHEIYLIPLRLLLSRFLLLFHPVVLTLFHEIRFRVVSREEILSALLSVVNNKLINGNK